MISETWVPERRYGVIPHDPVSVTTRSCITDPNERAGNRDTQDLSSGIEGTAPSKTFVGGHFAGLNPRPGNGILRPPRGEKQG